MSPPDSSSRSAETGTDPVERAMQALRKAERARRRAINALIELGVVRSRTFVGDLGEQLVADYYGVDLEPPSTPGFDLCNRDGKRVQVRTLRSTTENYRTTIGYQKEPYDQLFVVRLDEDYRPTVGLEVARRAIKELFGDRRITWTRGLGHHPRTKRIGGDVLLRRQAAHRRRRRTKYSGRK